MTKQQHFLKAYNTAVAQFMRQVKSGWTFGFRYRVLPNAIEISNQLGERHLCESDDLFNRVAAEAIRRVERIFTLASRRRLALH
jgi:hypothetical protein